VKIALVGSAPSSVHLTPFQDPTWEIWGCSPGLFGYAKRITEWYELHRYEPGVVGLPDTQKSWFSPEYVSWLTTQPIVWMAEQIQGIPGSRPLPVQALLQRWGSYFMTSTIAWMFAMALDRMITARPEGRPTGDEIIGLFGVDMSATEEYGYQRAGCQHFMCLANMLGIGLHVPAESDLLRPMPLYGIDESKPWMIKNTARVRELNARLQNALAQLRHSQTEHDFLRGALDDMQYQVSTWGDARLGLAPNVELIRFMKDPEPPKA